MTAAEWDASTDPVQMLAAAGQQSTNRQLLLLSCGCARCVWNRLPESVRLAIPQFEQAADLYDPELHARALGDAVATAVGAGAVAGVARLMMMRPDSSSHLPIAQLLAVLRRLETQDLPDGAMAVGAFVASIALTQETAHSPTQAAVVRCLVSNPLREWQFDPEWRTSDVMALAAGAYSESAFDRLPILADALQDAGCTDDHLLDHLRSIEPHARGCWVLDQILGKR
jgi:hypothetical protein